MKKKIMFLVGCFGLLVVNAQNWALPSSTWLCAYNWMGIDYPYTVKVIKDTIIDNVNCKKIGNETSIDFTYSSNDTVYFYLDHHFRSTYYFNAHVGDTVTYWNTMYRCEAKDTVIKAIVTSFDSVVLLNQTLRSFNTIVIPDSTGLSISYPLVITYTEKIGSGYIYPVFYPLCMIDESTAGICDYGDNTIYTFFIGLNSGCQTGITEINDAYITISPNPATNQINISTGSIPITEICIYNTTGSLVSQTKLPQSNSIDISQLAQGVYISEIKLTPKSPQGNYNTVKRRWVKM